MCKTATPWRAWCCAFALALVACGDSETKRARDAGADAGDESTGKDEPDELKDSGTDDAPNANTKGRLRGRVTYADGTALGQVDVRVAGKVFKSDSRGVFSADDLGQGDQELVIEDGRVSRAQLKVKIKGDRLTQAELSVLPLKQFQVKDVSADAELSDSTSGAFKIALKADSLRRKNSKEIVKGAAEARYAVAPSASPSPETYTKVTTDETLNRGLPDSLTFMTTSYGGTESNLNPRPGAVIYYDSMMLDAGLLGWPYNLGRVASFSTTVGANQVADATFVRLIANSIDWAQKD